MLFYAQNNSDLGHEGDILRKSFLIIPSLTPLFIIRYLYFLSSILEVNKVACSQGPRSPGKAQD